MSTIDFRSLQDFGSLALPAVDFRSLQDFGSLAYNPCPLGEKRMLEIEMKFPVADFAGIEQNLRHRQARPDQVREEEDHYFNAPDRDFARTDEALRLRCVGLANVVTYKGP